jgi:hypothetical protein
VHNLIREKVTKKPLPWKKLPKKTLTVEKVTQKAKSCSTVAPNMGS